MRLLTSGLIFTALLLTTATAWAEEGRVQFPRHGQTPTVDQINRARAAPVLSDPTAHVKVEMIADTTAVAPEHKFRLGIILSVEPGWHIYYKELGRTETGLPTSVHLNLPQGYLAQPLVWPAPTTFEQDGLKARGYEGRVFIWTTIEAPPAKAVSIGTPLNLAATVDFLACKESCVPGSVQASMRLPTVSNGNQMQPANINRFPTSPSPPVTPGQTTSGAPGFWWALVLAFVGGALLNLMPCVLPVLFIKVRSLMLQSGNKRSVSFRHGLAYTSGTLMTFLALAVVVIIAQQAGYTIGWGFQFQQPIFVVVLALLMTVFALSLFGLYFVQISSGDKLNELSQSKGYRGAFFQGVLATLLSTPCTAPFLGAALGFAFMQPWWVIISVFLTAGFGLSFPFLMLAAFPELLRWLPKPGAWMEWLKELMGFGMLGTVVWLLSILEGGGGTMLVLGTLAVIVVGSVTTVFTMRLALQQSRSRQLSSWLLGIGATLIVGWWLLLPPLQNPLPADTLTVSRWLSILLCSSLGLWIIARFGQGSTTRRVLVGAISIALSLGSAWLFLERSAPAAQMQVEPFSDQALKSHLAAGEIVLVDFTADWCLTCKVNEKMVLNSRSVQEYMKQHRVVVLRADWTNGDQSITKELQRFGRSGVPLYLLFSPNRPEQPIVLPEVITPQILLDGIQAAATP